MQDDDTIGGLGSKPEGEEEIRDPNAPTLTPPPPTLEPPPEEKPTLTPDEQAEGMAENPTPGAADEPPEEPQPPEE